MAVDADILTDRRRLKRRLMFWRTLTIVAVVAVAVVAYGRFTGFGGFGGKDYIAQLSVTGVIVDDERRHRLLARIADDHNAKALIVRIDSPGGTVVGGEALHASIRSVAEKKPVVALMGQVATSAGYMVAIAADRIFAHEGTITGSIGVILQTTELTGLLGKLGIATEAIKSGPLKAAPSPFEPITPDVRRVTQALVNDIHQIFVALVAKRRALDLENLRPLVDGRVFTGNAAMRNRLIDAIGGEAEAKAWLSKEKDIDPGLRIRDMKPARKVDQWFDFLDALDRKTMFSERLTLDGLVSVWHPALR
jgi:protease-4